MCAPSSTRRTGCRSFVALKPSAPSTAARKEHRFVPWCSAGAARERPAHRILCVIAARYEVGAHQHHAHFGNIKERTALGCGGGASPTLAAARTRLEPLSVEAEIAAAKGKE